MRKFAAIIKFELLRYFMSPVAYVYLLTFLFLNASFTLYLGYFLERGQADLSLMFGYQPWIYLIFISGIAMRLWAEEFKTQTVTQILSLPVSVAQLVWGKFAAAWIFCSFALALTFPFAVTANVLGQPDNGIITASYLGSFLLAGAMLATAQTMSSLTKSQVIALVLAVIVNLLFFLSGLEYVLRFFRSFLPDALVENIAYLSFLSHYGDLCGGVIGLRDIVFFASVIILFNFMTEVLVRGKTSGVAPIIGRSNKFGYAWLIISAWLIFAGFNLTINAIFAGQRIDMTEDKTFTLSPAAEQILRDIKEPVTIRVYYSPVLSSRNALFRKAVDRLEILLKTLQQRANGRLSYRFYYPEPMNRAEDMAMHDKLQPIPLPDLNQSAFFGITLIDEAGKQEVIPYIPLENIEKIESEILQKIYTFSHRKPTLGIVSSLPLFGQVLDADKVGTNWRITDEIKALYNIKMINKPEDLRKIDVLALLHPQSMSSALVDKIAAYTLGGGKILVLADVAAEAQRLYSPVNQRFSPSQLGNLEKLWGFEFNPSVIVADLDNSLTVNAGSKKHALFVQDVIQLNLPVVSAEPEVKNLRRVLLTSATPINHIKGHDTTFIPLLQTSHNSALFPAEAIYQNLNPADILAQFKSDNLVKTVAAKIISNKPEHPFEVIVIGDSDLAYDDFWSQYKTFDEYQYAVVLNDNANLILNALDSLSDNQAMVDLRRSADSERRFEAWERLRKQNSLTVTAAERKLLAEIDEVKTQLNDLWRKKNFEERQDFSDDELEVIAQFRSALQKSKQQLAEVRTKVNANLAKQQNLAVLFNLYAVPLLIICGLGIFVFCHRKACKYRCQTKTRMSVKLMTLTVGGCMLFALGLFLSLHQFGDRNDFENQPVFSDWQQQLNNISHIRFKHQNQVLHFYKKDGMWQIESFEGYPLYQRRVVNFLATLSNARFLERKSARAEYLPKFGLDATHATAVTLSDEDNRPLLQFDIGRYDVEIGRGGRGAFLKFSNKFQVWLIEADFLSLSTDWREWTLNAALNLRFGRLLKSDLTNNEDMLLLLFKEFINTPLTLSHEQTSELSLRHKIWLTFENGDNFGINLWQKGSKYYLSYRFVEQPQGNYLQLFAKYATGKLYEISEQNAEKINDVIESVK